ncbi:hypothetical protein [Thermostaphylospora chromogena]|uniref:Uncharacterized protein n=1 Tax=Thermostaphylospora chromogena TaxID=35622 RepID=A0A1H1I026_9ACTN|nr:hypothetical protein [Thermostaphylospora chromogena]SDR30708.1 hypothetical protein SAMN04489764_4988 [Thermostaphylospora chromogena]
MAPADEFCGIDPEAMNRMAASLRGAADRLAAFHGEFDRKLRENGITTPAMPEISHIAEWGKSQAPMLHHRAELARRLNAAPTPAGELIRLPDAPDGFSDVAALASLYNHGVFVGPDGERRGELVHENIREIERLAHEPQAAAAFFALLDPEIRDALPTLIANTGSTTAKEDLAAFGKALGAALRARDPVPAFAKVRDDLLRPPKSKTVAWQRLALLHGADPPSRFRSAIARALVLDDFLKNPRGDFRAAGTTLTKTYGLSSDLVALGLGVLAGNGAAARDAFAKMGGKDVTISRGEKMKRVLDYTRTFGTGDDVARAFGRALEAGAGVGEEKPGRHSPAAAAFALDAILVTGPFGDAIPAPLRPALTSIATSYIHELVTGARFDRAVYRSSGTAVPENWNQLPGITPAFYLSPKDTYQFLKTFVGDKGLTDDFDKAVAAFRYDTLQAAARLDAQQKEDHFEDIAEVFGDLASVEGKALLDVRGERDAADEVVADILQNTLSLGIDQIPVVGGVAEVGWELAKTYAISGLLDEVTGNRQNRVEEALAARSDFVLRQKYDMARLLYEAGHPASAPPAELISDSTGTLKTFDELLAEAKREAGDSKPWEKTLAKKLIPYEKWLDSNEALDRKAGKSTKMQTSDQAKDEIRLWK